MAFPNSMVPVGGDFHINTSLAGYQAKAQVIGLANGNFLATWMTFDAPPFLAARLVASDGSPIGPDFAVTDFAGYDPDVAALSDGGFVFVWGAWDGQKYQVHARIFEPDGAASGSDFLLSLPSVDYQWNPSVTATANNGFAVAWLTRVGTNEAKVSARFYGNDGVAIGDEFVVDTPNVGAPAITGLPDGRVFIAWTTYTTGILGQYYEADGTPFGASFQIHTTAADIFIPPRVTQLPNGDLVVTWRTSGEANNKEYLRGRLLDSDGGPIGNDFIVNTTTPASVGDLGQQSVTSLPDGGFLVTWQHRDTLQIMGRAFSGSGTPQGDEFVVNTTPSSFPTYYVDAASVPGGVLIAWDSRESGQNDIRVRAFEYQGTSPTADYSISPITALSDESAGSVNFSVSRRSGLVGETVYISTTQTEGFRNVNDYLGFLNQPLTFAVGETLKTVSVPVVEDGVAEPNEDYALLVQRSANDPVSRYLAKSVFTIRDSDPAVGYSITPGSISLTETAGTATFKVTRSSGAFAEIVFVSTTQSEGFANSGDYRGTDYGGLLNRPIAFEIGEVTQDVVLSITNDATIEPDETFGIIVQRYWTDPYTTFLAKALFTITDDDGGAVAPSVSLGADIRITEGDGYIFLELALDQPAAQEVSVLFSTFKGSASAQDNDYYGAVDQIVRFLPGDQIERISVLVRDDKTAEPTEAFEVHLHNPIGLTIGDGTAQVTIVDNDSPGFTDKADRSVAFMATLAKAAYHLRAGEEAIPGVNEVKPHAKERYDEADIKLDFLTLSDLPTLQLDLNNPSLAFNGGIYTNNNAAALVGRAGDALYIAYRGTNDAFFGGDGLWFGPDRHDWLPSGMVEHFKLLSNFNTAVKEYISSSGIKEVFVTGHSLGAAMAQRFMQEYDLAPKASAVTFASPGYVLNGPGRLDGSIKNFWVEGDIIQAAHIALNVDGSKAFIHNTNTNFEFSGSELHDMDLYYRVAQTFKNANVDLGLIDSRFLHEGQTYPVDITYDIVSKDWLVSLPAGTGLPATVESALFLSSPDAAVIGGGPKDIFSTAHTTDPVAIDLEMGTASGSGLGSKILNGIRNIITGIGNDAVSGNAFGNVIEAGPGADTVLGLLGADWLIGGSGEGDDLYDGGGDVDTVVYASTTQGVSVNLSAASNHATGPEIGVDQIIDVENVIGGSGSDTIIGNDSDNYLDGGASADVLQGLGGNDTYLVDQDADAITEVAGGGTDLVISTALLFTLRAEVENLTLAMGAGNTFGIGNGLANVLLGNPGINTLVGKAGGDTLDGGAGADYLLGGVGNDLYKVDDTFDLVDEGGAFPAYAGSATDFDTISSTADWFWDVYSVGERLQIEEGAVGSDGAGTTIVGSVLSNAMIGNSGTNIMFGRGGADTYRPGDGVDWISLSLLGVTEQNSYVGVDGVNTIIIDKRTTGDFSYDIIFEFEVGKDKIDVRSYGYISAAQVLAQGVNDGHGNSYYALGDGFDYVFLVGVTKESVSASDFILRSLPVFGEI